MYKFYYTNGYGVTSYIQKSATSLWQIAWNPNIRKWLMRVNLTCVMLLIAFMQVSLASNAQKISLSKKNAPLTEIFKELRKQSGYDFVINKDQIKIAKPVSILVNGEDLINVLNKCFEDQPFTYSMEDKMIIVVNKKAEQVQQNVPSIDVRGRLVDENGTALVGASILVKGTERKTITNDNGEFSFANIDAKAILVISFIGYETKEVSAGANLEIIRMNISTDKLDEVNVVSTGYQTLPKERATGAFTQIDSKTITRNVGINILDRLEGLASGLILNRSLAPATNNSKITIRGRSTIFANTSPLIVLDGFPYEGTIDQINPADVENISILKDAAAASIWGTRASNGVIVITTKKGKNNQKLAVEVFSTITVSAKQDLYYTPQVSSTDFIDLEQFLYSKGNYNNDINRKFAPISQAVEIFIRKKTGQISFADSIAQIDALKGRDVRSEIDKYLNRSQVYQQYQMNLKGGGENNRYYLSGGYDRNLESQVTNNFQRMSLSANNSFSLIKNRLEINSSINFTSSTANLKYDAYRSFSPYELLKDGAGNSLPTTNALRQLYVDTVGNGKLLDWSYRPLDEINPNQQNNLIQYRIKVGAEYQILEGLRLSAYYQYLKENGANERNFSSNDYYARNIINRYSSIAGNTVTRNIKLGDIFDTEVQEATSKILRFQLGYDKIIAKNHEINFIAGYEGSDGRIDKNSQTIYGYDPETLTNGNNLINPLLFYKYYYDPGLSEKITTAPQLSGNVNISQSYYGNFSYAYKGTYVISASARKDESNLFGVKSNQKGVPLWSAGLAWNVSKENFYGLNWLPLLKIRATYGYNGNVDKTVSGYLTVVNLGQINSWGSIYSQILNPPNPSLSWEKVAVWNLGLDYALKNDRVSGSLDLYKKNAEDLIGNSPIAGQSGVLQYKGNNANLSTKVDKPLQNDPCIPFENDPHNDLIFLLFAKGS